MIGGMSAPLPPFARHLIGYKSGDETWEEFARRIHASSSLIRLWRKGMLPQLDTALEVAAALEVSVNALVAGVREDYDKVLVTLPDTAAAILAASTPRAGGEMSAAQERLVSMVRGLRDDEQAQRAYEAFLRWLVQDELERGAIK